MGLRLHTDAADIVALGRQDIIRQTARPVAADPVGPGLDTVVVRGAPVAYAVGDRTSPFRPLVLFNEVAKVALPPRVGCPSDLDGPILPLDAAKVAARRLHARRLLRRPRHPDAVAQPRRMAILGEGVAAGARLHVVPYTARLPRPRQGQLRKDKRYGVVSPPPNRPLDIGLAAYTIVARRHSTVLLPALRRPFVSLASRPRRRARPRPVGAGAVPPSGRLLLTALRLNIADPRSAPGPY